MKIGGSAYFHDIIEAFVSKGYARGKDIASAPYDFRYSAKSNPDEYLINTINLVEELYENGGQEKVLLVSHSMGGLWSQYLLTNVSEEWKDKYIKSWIPIAPAYGGTVHELKLFASGDNEGIPLVGGLTVREEQRSYESNFWLLPNPELWEEDEVILQTLNGFYTAHTMKQFFMDIEFDQGFEIWDNMKEIFSLQDPNVEVHVKYGTLEGKTADRYNYNTDDVDDTSQLETVYGKGDGTVNLRSLRAAEKKGWKDVSHDEYAGEDHTTVLKNEGLINELLAYAGAA